MTRIKSWPTARHAASGGNEIMPIPNALRSLMHDPAFWSDYFGEQIYCNSYASLADPSIHPSLGALTIPIVFTITPRHRLRLLLSENLNAFNLKLFGTQDNSETIVAHGADDGHPGGVTVVPLGCRPGLLGCDSGRETIVVSRICGISSRLHSRTAGFRIYQESVK
jgi:hypothetical protein